MLPEYYEKSLLSWQYEKRVSLFACDGWDVYSNQKIKLPEDDDSDEHFHTKKVDSDLKCEKGGEFGTALNKDIFAIVWKKVFDDGKYRNFDWTVKVDPDAVFFAERLKTSLYQHPIVQGGLYIVNCPMGLHGPLEVFSQEAVTSLVQRWDECEGHFNQMCSGDCQWGEDMWVDQCLSKVLNVRCEHDNRLLIEDHCDPPAGWLDCPATLRLADGSQPVSLHPFKTQERYEQCYNSALR
jgi:hypothetical protein